MNPRRLRSRTTSAVNPSDLDLERLLDADLDQPARERLEDQLAHDPALAARLNQLTAIDDRLRAALVDAHTTPPRARPRAAPLGLAAASLLIVASMSWWLLAPRHAAPEPAVLLSTPFAATPRPADAHAPARVLLALPAPRRPHRPSALPPSDALSRAIDAGSEPDAARAAETLASASDPERAAALERLAKALRSGSAAVAALDRLPATEQIILCRELAIDGSLRPLALDRLRTLSADPHLSDHLRHTIASLADRPGMTPWLRSYGLIPALEG